jgi:hypothetical protein
MNILVACGLMSGRGINDHVPETEKKKHQKEYVRLRGKDLMALMM